MRLSRRHFVQAALVGASAASLARPAFAETSMPAWQIGYRNAPADGFSPEVMQKISGRVPDGLTGTLYRNGPAHFTYGEETLGHWFDGDGMIQRLRIEAGKVVHSGEFVATRKRIAQEEAGRFLAPGFGSVGDPSYPMTGPDDTNAANTSVLPVGEDIWALWEAGSPYRLDPDTLETDGPVTLAPVLKGMPFLAHPKVEPGGEIWNLGVMGSQVVVYHLAADGALKTWNTLDIGVAAYIHDWAMTDRHLVILVQPWVMTRMVPPFVNSLAWQPELGLRALIIDKDDFSARRWAQCPPRAFFHTGSAWAEQDGTIRLDVALYAEPVLGSGGGTNEMKGQYDASEYVSSDFAQLVLPPSGDGQIVSSGASGEFPQVHPAFSGRQRDFAVLCTGEETDRPGATALTAVNWRTGDLSTHEFGRHQIVEEFLVTPKPGATNERAAWVIGTTLNIRAQASELHVFDLAAVSDGPLVSWRSSRAWPLGFHGAFVAA